MTAIAAITVLALVLAPLVGLERIGLEAILRPVPGEIGAEIFWRIRLPRVLLAFLAGAALSLGGMAFQALFRNALATPFTLGVSSGAAFGAALYVLAGAAVGVLGLAAQSLSAFLGALLSIGVVYGLTRTRHGFSTATMLLAGVAVNFFFSSLILFLQYLSDFTDSYRIMRWLMGGIETVGYGAVLRVAPFVLIGGAVVLLFTHELNLITLGEEVAVSRGVETRSVRRALFLATSLMVGGVVAQCGPIGFVGMMAPHICRLLLGGDHRKLAPASFLFGGTFLVLCDIVSRLLIAPAEIPVGVVTALLGGPFFLWLLLGGSSERSLLSRL